MTKICSRDGKPCANPQCSPGYCFPDSPGRAPRPLNTRPVASMIDPETVEACAKVAEEVGVGNTKEQQRTAGYRIVAALRALGPGKTASAGVREG